MLKALAAPKEVPVLFSRFHSHSRSSGEIGIGGVSVTRDRYLVVCVTGCVGLHVGLGQGSLLFTSTRMTD